MSVQSIEQFTRFFFLGIGGIGMSAIARYYKVQGFDVAGYDRTATKLTADLQSEGIELVYEAGVSAIPARFTDKLKTLVVLDRKSVV